ncbi:MAG TPA: DnaB-like helicase C-terminal domain-containing protein [Thermosynergistes sp.]|nr:DnaB-like helicase C-terminal domain-containing protein [Thermosynergistes sp.]HQE21962.1 DnaB-like helicase C-terminal domain-containing protein [Thermosynergistes sp.]
MSGLDLNGIAAARDIVSSLDEHAARGFAEDVLLEEAKRLFSFGVQAADMVQHLSTKAAQIGISFSKTELRRIVAKAVAKESERYVTSPTTAAYIRDLAEEIRSWEEGERFSFGIPVLDDAFGRLCPGEVLVLVGAQGAMKTSLLLSGLENYIATTNGNVLFFSLDMKPEEITERRLMRAMNMSASDVRWHIRNDSALFNDCASSLNKADGGRFVILGNKSASRFTAETVCQKITSMMPSLVAIDYLTLLRKQRQSDLDCVNEAMPMLKSIAQEYGIMMIILSQMGRASKQLQASGSLYSGSAKGGGIVEELANAQVDVFKDAPVNELALPRIIATIAKTRRGVAGKSFELEYDGRTMSFTGKAVPVKRLKAQKQVFASSIMSEVLAEDE